MADRRRRAGEGAPRGRGRVGTESGVQRVAKRDGREVRFDRSKIEAATAAALEAVGDADPTFAGEVAAVVDLALADRAARSEPDHPRRYVPTIEAIQDLVERALMDLGRPQAAKAYILYRDRRTRIRDALRVHRSDVRASVRVREAEGVSAWSKGRIVAALIDEAELPRTQAEEVAAAVERRVFASGLKRISTGLVRELVAGELLERGWTRALARQDVVGLARHDLRTLRNEGSLQEWERGTSAPGDLTDAVARELLRRWSLDDLLPDGVAELHRAGDLHVEDVGRPHVPLCLSVEADLVARGGPGPATAFRALDAVAELARDVSRRLVLERPAGLLTPLLRATRPGSPLGLGAWLAALTALARATGVRIDFGSSGPRHRAFNVRLVEELAELPAGPAAPGLFLEGHELEALLGDQPQLAPAVDRLFAQGRLWSTWSEGQESFAAPGCMRRARERGVLACGGAIALNLPRLARRAGPFREEIVLAGLAELVQAALEVSRALERFQRADGAPRPGGLFARASWALVPVGLREALLILGEGEIDRDQGARLLGLMSEAAARFSLAGASTVAPCPFFGERAARRFAWLDRRAAAAEGRQRWLFGEADRAEAAGYTDDLGLAPLTGAASGRPEAEVLRTLSAGAFTSVGLVSPLDPPSETPHLDAWRRFEVLRRSHAGEIALELFPVPVGPSGAESSSGGRRPRPLRPLA